ncbi:MAG: phosphoribosylformylglycinamidine synthase subunit PurQ [Rhodospirillales bacterium]|nr:phosphoribosylformylglycinamidine synthase subunit PurQ [Rhodospirillales bacterium]
MKSAVIVFPGSNCDRDAKVALEDITGGDVVMQWHGDADMPDVDLIVVPGGFSYGDYLRCGAIAGNSPVMREVKKRADAGTPVIGICNGFQVLTEVGLLPGVLMRNANLKFVCKDVHLSVETASSVFTGKYKKGEVIRIPVAHHDGNYFADNDTMKKLADDDRIAFRYVSADGKRGNGANPNGSMDDIAGILNDKRNVLGMMPHPERLADKALGGTDGRPMFESVLATLS